MKNLTWPQAFVTVAGGLPALVLLLGAFGVYPAVILPVYAVTLGVYVWRVQTTRRDIARKDALALAHRADLQHALLHAEPPEAAAITVPFRRGAA